MTWEQEKEYLRRKLCGICDRVSGVNDAPRGILGCTDRNGNVCIARNHPYIEAVGEDNAPVLRYGVGVHEAGHLLFTSFDHTEELIKKEEKRLQKEGIFARAHLAALRDILNIVEDPAMESMMYGEIGGAAIRALDYAIRTSARLSGNVTNPEPLIEYTNALVMFGDGSPVKGNFLSEEAHQLFLDTVKDFYEAINDPDPVSRLDKAFLLYEKAKTLLPKEDSDLSELAAAIVENAQESGRTSPAQTEGAGMTGTMGNTKLDEQRKAILGKLLAERNDDETAESEDQEESSDETVDAPADLIAQIRSEQDAERLAQALKRADHDQYDEQPPDLSQQIMLEMGAKFSGKFLEENAPEHGDLSGDAAQYRMKNANGVSEAIRRLRRLFQRDRESCDYASSGKYALKRSLSGRISVNQFTKRRRLTGKRNIAVSILVDNSGSMGGKKLESAKGAALALCDIFAELDIPVYVTGFHSDGTGDSLQTHYVKWKATEYERQNILLMKAGGENYDAYAIRYAAKILAGRKAEHKLLMVISDGLPSVIGRKADGIEENRESIYNARKCGIDVIGFGIGNIDRANFERMYDTDCYVHVGNEDLFTSLCEKVSALVKKW